MSFRSWQGILVDVLAGAYAAALSYRIVCLRMVLEKEAVPVHFSEPVVYGIAGLIMAVLGLRYRCTLGAWMVDRRLPQGWRQLCLLHIGLSLLVLTVWAGWVVTRISPVDLFSPKGLESAGRLFAALLTPEIS
ncbi:MAG: hypothetical protein NZ473_05220, partial [Candidatus Kapabacteria bacterium]|nr:hypothetical protein [Candidatus Kapabacteria bacterium]MDW8225803.1 hypothetical protein [Bacteroidota bacterium]